LRGSDFVLFIPDGGLRFDFGEEERALGQWKSSRSGLFGA